MIQFALEFLEWVESSNQNTSVAFALGKNVCLSDGQDLKRNASDTLSLSLVSKDSWQEYLHLKYLRIIGPSKKEGLDSV